MIFLSHVISYKIFNFYIFLNRKLNLESSNKGQGYNNCVELVTVEKLPAEGFGLEDEVITFEMRNYHQLLHYIFVGS
ncbi:hypothetical protein P3S67_005130 [Capsicum chacoense]